ncbi:glycosyltransferase involved in cell wall biosynthesis [Silvibacterium bohemicum]|uniref:Glycosyltransferase involved in cell wall biosynthesis n=1 Tax=Silvibacterium bohemicum TaxID=1577686 RepID=A0A841JWQ9_9BACT|nr:glycosyltransferase family 4 protein [Silvibacterium bohemicum]MBB6142878.1 glycosyltransferase involved in cell wall biosynthesis [Silvibacterium bohemicum]
MVTFSPYPFDPRPRRAIDALVSEGMMVDLICLGNKATPKRERQANIDVTRVRVNKEDRGGKLKYAFRYARFIAFSSLVFGWRSFTRGYDLVYVHNMPDILVLCSLIPRALGAKVILDMHDPMPELMMTIYNAGPQTRSVRMLRKLEKWSQACANLVLTPNIACKRLFSSRSCNAEKIEVVMNSPDEKIFPFRAARSRTSAKLKDKSFVVMYHGSLVERNGLDLAMDALARVQKTNPNIELRICGHATPFLDRMMETARSKNLKVCYLGPKKLEELILEIEDCDVGVIPNHRSAFTEINTPTRIFEYLTLGKPVIAPCTPGIEDYFPPNSLLFFEPGNAEQLAQQIEYVVAHPAEVVTTTERGQQVYLDHTWSKERQGVVNGVSNLLSKRKLNGAQA